MLGDSSGSPALAGSLVAEGLAAMSRLPLLVSLPSLLVEGCLLVLVSLLVLTLVSLPVL